MEIYLLNWKFYLSILITVILCITYIYYIKNIFSNKVTPHLYTWLVWSITLSIASAGILYGGGMWAALPSSIAVLFIIFITILCLKYGTRNITKSDTLAFVGAVTAIFFWIFLENPFLSVLTVSLIDGLSYFPTIRKTFYDPNSETPSAWLIMFITSVMGIVASAEYNFYTIFYSSISAIGNLFVFCIAYIKR